MKASDCSAQNNQSTSQVTSTQNANPSSTLPSTPTANMYSDYFDNQNTQPKTSFGDKVITKLASTKLFNANDGYGFRINKSTEILYQNPRVNGVTIVSIKTPDFKWRWDWDPMHSFHTHRPGHTGHK